MKQGMNRFMKVGSVIEIRGVCFDAGWEFDAPCVIYHPFKAYGGSNNNGGIDSLVEDVLIDFYNLEKPLPMRWDAQQLDEFKWRGWSPTGFAKRKHAEHVRIIVKVVKADERDFLSGLAWEDLKREEKLGPFDRRIHDKI